MVEGRIQLMTDFFVVGVFAKCPTGSAGCRLRTRTVLGARKSAENLELLSNWQSVREGPVGPGVAPAQGVGPDRKFAALSGGRRRHPATAGFLLEFAAVCRDREEVAFVLVGGVNQKKKLQAIAMRYRLENTHSWERTSSSDFARLPRQAGVDLVNLNRRFAIPNCLPQVLDPFEGEVPVVPSFDGTADLGAMSYASGAGLRSLNGGLPAYPRNPNRLTADLRLRRPMSRRSRESPKQHLAVERARYAEHC